MLKKVQLGSQHKVKIEKAACIIEARVRDFLQVHRGRHVCHASFVQNLTTVISVAAKPHHPAIVYYTLFSCLSLDRIYARARVRYTQGC